MLYRDTTAHLTNTIRHPIMTTPRQLTLLTMLCAVFLSIAAGTPIRGRQEADAELMYRYIVSHNPDFPREIAQAFYDIGRLYGIRGDIAICQAIIETGWFRFDNGTAVRPSSHNYCGLGVRKRGTQGCSFRSVHEGVTAMMQHLYAYSCHDPLPQGENLLDPRFRYVTRGSASSWEALSGRWAMNRHYGKKILDLFKKMMSHDISPLTAETVEQPAHTLPDEETMIDKSFFE